MTRVRVLTRFDRDEFLTNNRQQVECLLYLRLHCSSIHNVFQSGDLMVFSGSQMLPGESMSMSLSYSKSTYITAYHIISYRIASHCIASHRIVSYHIISYLAKLGINNVSYSAKSIPLDKVIIGKTRCLKFTNQRHDILQVFSSSNFLGGSL